MNAAARKGCALLSFACMCTLLDVLRTRRCIASIANGRRLSFAAMCYGACGKKESPPVVKFNPISMVELSV